VKETHYSTDNFNITKKKLIIVEGYDDKKLIYALIEKIKINGFQFMVVEGKPNFHIKLPVLPKSPNYSYVECIAIIRDADNNSESAFQSLCSTVKKMGLLPPKSPGKFTSGKPRVGIFIAKGIANKGSIEDLCLKSQEIHPIMCCVEEYIKCLTKLKQKPRNPSKSRALVFLAGMKEIKNNIGDAAQKGYWDLDSPAFNDLKKFLLNLK